MFKGTLPIRRYFSRCVGFRAGLLPLYGPSGIEWVHVAILLYGRPGASDAPGAVSTQALLAGRVFVTICPVPDEHIDF